MAQLKELIVNDRDVLEEIDALNSKLALYGTTPEIRFGSDSDNGMGIIWALSPNDWYGLFCSVSNITFKHYNGTDWEIVWQK